MKKFLAASFVAVVVLLGTTLMTPGTTEEEEDSSRAVEKMPQFKSDAEAQRFFFGRQDKPPDQPHTADPAKCTRYCYPHGGPNLRPKGTPEGIPGYECQGDKCAKINDEPKEGEDNCAEGGGCTSYCAKVCCSCLATCL